MMPDVWPAGSRVVIMDGRPAQITIPTAARGRMRHFRYGPVKRAVTDGSYRHVVETIKGNGLRPYPVVHLRAARSAGDLRFAWIRQTRIDGDLWGRGDVPLGEETQTYVVQVRQGDAVRREESVDAPGWVYTAAMQAADGVSSGYVVTVAQLSARYGTGPFTGLAVS
jgi:hypothetical protein